MRQEVSQSPTLMLLELVALRPLWRASTLRHESVGIPERESDRTATPKSRQRIRKTREGDDTYLGWPEERRKEQEKERGEIGGREGIST
jgi:hypothetical protein